MQARPLVFMRARFTPYLHLLCYLTFVQRERVISAELFKGSTLVVALSGLGGDQGLDAGIRVRESRGRLAMNNRKMLHPDTWLRPDIALSAIGSSHESRQLESPKSMSPSWRREDPIGQRKLDVEESIMTFSLLMISYPASIKFVPGVMVSLSRRR